MSKKRTVDTLEEEEYLSEDSEDNSSHKRSRSSTEEASFSPLVYDSPSGKIVLATVRVLLGLSNRSQVLNKTIISKILETENEKGVGLQFKKHILPGLQKVLGDVFRYEIVGLPSKKVSMKIFKTTDVPDNIPSKNYNADEFILVNKLPLSLRALNYSFLADNSKPIEKSIKEMEKPKSGTDKLIIYGEGLPRPTSNVVQNGIKLLIICIIVLHSNNMLQSDLIIVLQTNFGLKFKEGEVVSMLGNQTLSDFITMLCKQEYLERSLISDKTSNRSLKKSLNGKNARYDDNTLVITLGRKCLEEWSKDEFVNLFRQLMQDHWTEQLNDNARYTVSQIWKN